MCLPWRAGVSKLKIPVERSFPVLYCTGGGAAGRGERSEKGLGEQRVPELWPVLPLLRIQPAGECRACRAPGRASVVRTNPPVVLVSVYVACKSVITVCASCRANSDLYDIALFIQIFIYLPYPPPTLRPSRQLIWSFKVEENKTVWRRVGARKSRTAVTGTGMLFN